jgi:hypothetical protein
MSKLVKLCRNAPPHVDVFPAISALMPLPKADYKRRLDAALALNGTTLDQIDATLEEHWGLGKEAASRAGRPSDKREPSQSLSVALGRELGVGEAWFEAPDWRAVLSEGAAAAETGDDLEKLKAQRSVLLSTIAQVRSELEDLRKRR